MKQLPSLEEAVDNFRSAYEVLLRRSECLTLHMQLNKPDDRDVLLLLAIDAKSIHGAIAQQAIKEYNESKS